MYRANRGFPRAMAAAAASRAGTECLPGNHDKTRSVPSWQFPAASEASRVMATSGMELMFGAAGAGPGGHLQQPNESLLGQPFAQWPFVPRTVQGSSTFLPWQPSLVHPQGAYGPVQGSASVAVISLGQRKGRTAAANPDATYLNALRRGMGI